jgi:hypothetical protein
MAALGSLSTAGTDEYRFTEMRRGGPIGATAACCRQRTTPCRRRRQSCNLYKKLPFL